MTPTAQEEEQLFEKFMEAESYCYNEGLPFTAARAYDAALPYCAQQPAKVSLEKCANAVRNELYSRGNSPRCYEDFETGAICDEGVIHSKAVLESLRQQGVEIKYAEDV